jgi:uracil phosphoribosyltransferase
MATAVERAVGDARLCLLGLRRNEETLQPETYHDGLPLDLSGCHVIVCDPMLATGGSLLHALELVTQRGVSTVTALCLLAAQPGVDAVTKRFPEVRLVVGAIDAQLNEHGYIVPGLGDAGDRQFGPPVHH